MNFFFVRHNIFEAIRCSVGTDVNLLWMFADQIIVGSYSYRQDGGRGRFGSRCLSESIN